MPICQEVEQINGFYHIIKNRPVSSRRRDREPASPTRNPDPNFAIIMLAVGIVCYILNHDALRKIVTIKNCPGIKRIASQRGKHGALTEVGR